MLLFCDRVTLIPFVSMYDFVLAYTGEAEEEERKILNFRMLFSQLL